MYFHLSLAEKWLLFCVFSKTKFFVAKEKSDLHKRQLIKYHEKFPILVFEGSLSIEMALSLIISKRYHYVINFGIVSNSYIIVDPGLLERYL